MQGKICQDVPDFRDDKNRRVVFSVDTHDTCAILYQDEGCGGTNVQVKDGQAIRSNEKAE